METKVTGPLPVKVTFTGAEVPDKPPLSDATTSGTIPFVEAAVGTTTDGAHVVLWVADDGPGMDADDLEHVFEPFYRSPRSAARTSGSGLGLAIVHQLVHAMDGTVRATTDSEGGCRVTVTLKPWKTAT